MWQRQPKIKRSLPRLTLWTVFTFAALALVSALVGLAQGSGGPALRVPHSAGGWACLAAYSCVAAFAEEVLFRYLLYGKLAGWLQSAPPLTPPASGRGINVSPPPLVGEAGWGSRIKLAVAVFSSAVFASMHLWEGGFGALNAFIAGLVLCFSYEKSKSLTVVAVAHAAYNLAAFAMA
jgi:membrane protease YdiL (CAAX protease family)